MQTCFHYGGFVFPLGVFCSKCGDISDPRYEEEELIYPIVLNPDSQTVHIKEMEIKCASAAKREMRVSTALNEANYFKFLFEKLKPGEFPDSGFYSFTFDQYEAFQPISDTRCEDLLDDDACDVRSKINECRLLHIESLIEKKLFKEFYTAAMASVKGAVVTRKVFSKFKVIKKRVYSKVFQLVEETFPEGNFVVTYTPSFIPIVLDVTVVGSVALPSSVPVVCPLPVEEPVTNPTSFVDQTIIKKLVIPRKNKFAPRKFVNNHFVKFPLHKSAPRFANKKKQKVGKFYYYYKRKVKRDPPYKFLKFPEMDQKVHAAFKRVPSKVHSREINQRAHVALNRVPKRMVKATGIQALSGEAKFNRWISKKRKVLPGSFLPPGFSFDPF